MRNLLNLLLLLLFLSCTATVEESKTPFDDLDKRYSAFFPEGEPGAAILVAKNGEIVFTKGYGIADMGTGEAITSKTLFNVGSISKTFVSNAILKLEEEGLLSVEDNMLKYFPDFVNKEIGDKVKIKHLLTHTSGLPDNRNVSEDTVFYLTAKDSANWAPELLVDSLHFQPGTDFEYSNPAFNGLALIIEQVTGARWQDYIIDNIMRPAGMLSSTITDGPHPESGVSHGYEFRAGEFVEDDYGEEPTFAASGNGGVWSSVEELFQYEKAIQAGIFLPEEKIATSRVVKDFGNWQGESDPYIGWSWFITQTTDGFPMIGHTGSQGGFRANYQLIPDRGIFFVILCNTPREGFSNIIFEWLAENNWLDRDSAEQGN